MDGFDRDTGEISPVAVFRPMPKAIAEAVVKVAGQVKMVGVDSKNEHGKYNYVSIDKFMEVIGPKMAEAGLVLVQDEVSADIRNQGDKGWLFLRYAFALSHTSGESWGPVYRSVALQALGPQSFGAAESYMMKRFLRGIFMVPTGDRDADDEEQVGLAAVRPTGRAPAPANSGKAYAMSHKVEAAPAPSDAKQDADKRFRELRNEIDASMTVPEAQDLEKSRAWTACHAAIVTAETERGNAAPAKVADEAMASLRNRIVKRVAMLMGEGEYAG